MSGNVEVSIAIRDRIGTKIAGKLTAIGKSAAAAAPSLEAFKRAWKGLDFTGISGLGLGSVEQQMKRTRAETLRLKIETERLAQSQIRTKIVAKDYATKLNTLRLQEQKMAEAGLGAVAANNAQAASQLKLRGTMVATARVTSDLTNKEISRQLLINQLAISNDNLVMSNHRLKESEIDLQIKHNASAIKAENLAKTRANTAKSGIQLATSNERLKTSQNGVVKSSEQMRKTLLGVNIAEEKAIKNGHELAVVKARQQAAEVSKNRTMNISALMTSKLTTAEIARQKELNKLARDQNATKLTTIAVAKASADLKLKLLTLSKAQGKLTATTSASKNAISQKSVAMQRLGIQVNDIAMKTERGALANKRFSRSFQELNGRILASRGALGGMVSNLRSYLSLGALIGAGAFLKGADTFTIIQNQLRGVTETSEQLESVTRGVFGIALRSRVPVKDLAVAYRRYDMALQQVGESQASTLRITETITKLLTLNGSTASESASALLQLSQAFNKGKLDGDEFRTTAEVMPQVLDEITKALGISRSEIFKFSKDGKVTIGILLKAFKGMEKEVDELMKNTDFTVGQSLTNLVTKIVWAFGKWNKATGFTRTLGDALRWVGENLDTVLRFIETLVASGITLALGSIAAAFASFVAATGGLGLIAPIIAGWVGAFTLLSDEIKVTQDGVVTLRDAIYGLFRNLPKIMKDLGASEGLVQILGLGKDLATSLGQLAFDGFLKFMKLIADAIMFVVSKIRSFIQAMKDFDSSIQGKLLKAMAGGTGLFSPEGLIYLFKQFITFLKEEFKIQFVDIISGIGNIIISIFEGIFNVIILKINGILERVKFLLSLYAMISPSADQFRLDSEASRMEAIPLAKFERFDSGSFAEKQRGDLSEAKALRLILEQSGKIFENQYEQVKDGLDQMVVDYIQSIREIKKVQDDVINEQNSQINKLKGLRGPGQNTFDNANASMEKMKETGGALQSVFSNLSNAFQNFVRTGKLSFKDLIRSMLADLLRLFMNNLFKQMFGGMLGGGGGGGGGIFGSLFGGGFSKGGVVPSANGSFGDGKQFGPMAGKYYANGGFTGGGARNGIAGFVHGQEYVMPASQTTKYRSTLDAMRNGTLKTGSTAGGGVMVNVNNYTDSDVSVKKKKNGELELTIREIARQQIAEQTPKLIATNLRNANSRESKALGQSTYTRRKR